MMNVVIVLQGNHLLSNKKEVIYVLDSNVFINNLSYLFNNTLIITTPFIEEELKYLPSKMDFYRASSMNLHVILPKKEYLGKVKKLVSKTKHKLSNADLSIIALSL